MAVVVLDPVWEPKKDVPGVSEPFPSRKPTNIQEHARNFVAAFCDLTFNEVDAILTTKVAKAIWRESPTIHRMAVVFERKWSHDEHPPTWFEICGSEAKKTKRILHVLDRVEGDNQIEFTQGDFSSFRDQNVNIWAWSNIRPSVLPSIAEDLTRIHSVHVVAAQVKNRATFQWE